MCTDSQWITANRRQSWDGEQCPSPPPANGSPVHSMSALSPTFTILVKRTDGF